MIICREAKQSDWSEIKRLISLYPEILMQTMLPSFNKFFVVEDNKFLIGCCALDVYSKRIAEIRSLVVMPGYEGQGVGKFMVEACLKRAESRGVYEVFAVTGQEDFFGKFGFKVFNNEKAAMFKLM